MFLLCTLSPRHPQFPVIETPVHPPVWSHFHVPTSSKDLFPNKVTVAGAKWALERIIWGAIQSSRRMLMTEKGKKDGERTRKRERNYWAQRAYCPTLSSPLKRAMPTFSCQLYFLAQHLVSERPRPRLSVNASVLGKWTGDANLGRQALANLSYPLWFRCYRAW